MKRKLKIKFPTMPMVLPKITEARLVNAVFGISPWLTPVITAWLVFNATRARLDWDWPQALISAAIVETNGISSTNLLLYLYRTKAERKLLIIAAGIVGVYAFVVLTLTVVLDTFPEAARFAPLLFVFLVLSSNATVALRAHHNTILASVRKGTAKAKPGAQLEEDGTNVPQLAPKPERKPVTTRIALRELFATAPETRMWTSDRLAERIGCTGANVRKVAHRNGDGGWVVES
jgi:hypothetical protein